MICTVFNGLRENKFLSCLLALLEPARAAVDSTEVTSRRLWKAGVAGTTASEPRTTPEPLNPLLADPQGRRGP